MTDGSPREIRDILAEALYVEVLGRWHKPTWEDLASYNAEACEQVMIRAGTIIRLLAEHGVELVQTGAPRAVTRPDGDIVWRYWLHGRKVERIVKRDGDAWQIVDIADGEETVVMAFTIAQARVEGGVVLTDDPSAKTIVGLGRRLAAALEIACLTGGLA